MLFPSLVLTLTSLVAAEPATSTHAATPAQRAQSRAAAAAQKSPDSPRPLEALAMAHSKRGRETAEPEHYERALEVAAKGLEIHPDDLGLQRARVWALLGLHRFAEALPLAQDLNRRVPDDLTTYALLADALVELGRYEEAEGAVQWMLDLRPGNVAGLTRGAYLREIYGDLDGARDWMAQAFQRLPGHEREDRAWVLVHLAALERQLGQLDAAEALLDRADALFPAYHYALRERVELLRARGEVDRAVEVARTFHRTSPHPENLLPLADALHARGDQDEAQRLYRTFEEEARAESDAPDNANLDLVLHLAERAGSPEEALRLARREAAKRRDVLTLEALATAEWANGRLEEAWETIQVPLRLGSRSASLYERARRIATDLGDPARLHELSLLAPSGPVAPPLPGVSR